MIKSIMESIFLDESLKSAKEFAIKLNISQDIFDKFNALDTTPTKKLVHQLLKWYVEDNTIEPSDNLIKELDTFIKFSGGRIKESIEQFKTYTSFKEFIAPFLDIETKADKKDALAGQYKKIFENENMVVVLPFTHKASCIYGAKTKWCTTAKTAQHFNTYQDRGNSIYYVINKKDTDENNPFHKMAVVVDKNGSITQCYDTFDHATYQTSIKNWIKNNGIPELATVFTPQHDSDELLAIKLNQFKKLKFYSITNQNIGIYEKIIEKYSLDEIFPNLTSMEFLATGKQKLPKIPSSVKKLTLGIYATSIKNLQNINDERDIEVIITLASARTFTDCNNLKIVLAFVGNMYEFSVNKTLKVAVTNMFNRSDFDFNKLQINISGLYSYGGEYFTTSQFERAINNLIDQKKTGKVIKKKVVKKKTPVKIIDDTEDDDE